VPSLIKLLEWNIFIRLWSDQARYFDFVAKLDFCLVLLVFCHNEYLEWPNNCSKQLCQTTVPEKLQTLISITIWRLSKLFPLLKKSISELYASPHLTQGVDFTNVFARIFCTRVSYERIFSSYVLQKTRTKNVGEIDPRLLMLLAFFSNHCFSMKLYVAK